LDEDFDPAEFSPPRRTDPCRLYLISPQEVGGDFPDQLRALSEVESVAAFQLRAKNRSEHEIARLADPLQRICADAGVAFIVNGSRQAAGSRRRASRAAGR
jgi:thiamine-phosphate pyrophosphorylase